MNYVDFINNNSRTAFSRKGTGATNIRIPDTRQDIRVNDSRPVSAFENTKYDLNSEQVSKIKIMKKPLKSL